jgi:SAM-dependent methyltransferase
MPQASVGARLLDVGFGDGKFLARAASAGYRVSGCDIDSDVIDAALKRGFDVRAGGIESFKNMPESFDVITLGHSIEHVYDPLATLRQAHALLKPGGMIWIETPNIRSYGHDRFGAHWRGLEPPRHLVLFHWEKLESVLKDVGFVSVTRLPFFENFYKLAKQSQAIIEGKDPNDWDPISEPSPWTVFLTWVQTRFWHPEKTEFITLIARKVSDKSR